MSNPLERPARSQFLKKLHRLLEHPTDAAGLRWVSDNTFEVTVLDELAIASLRPEFEFRSLGSFVRQLSYYNFKRLSDRRRSSERGTAKKGYIKFTHQSGHFIRGDASQISRIARRPRTNRPRRPSNVSIVSNRSGGSDEQDQAYPGVAWATQDSSQQFFQGGGPSHHQHASQSQSESFQGFLPVPGDRPAPDFANKWRNYTPGTAGFTNPAREAAAAAAAAAERQRRASMPVLNYEGEQQEEQRNHHEQQSQQQQHMMSSPPRSASPSYIPLPAVSERPPLDGRGRPGLRSHYSTTSVPTMATLAQPEPTHQRHHSQNSFRAPEYPTPEFDSSTNLFFTQPTFIPPAPPHAQILGHLPDLPQAHNTSQPRSFLSDLKFDPTYYAPGPTARTPPTPAAALPSPSEHGSNGCPSPRQGGSPPLQNAPHPLDNGSFGAVATSPYYQHYSQTGNGNEYVASSDHLPREMQQSYFPPSQFQQQPNSRFSPGQWSPGIVQA